MLLRVRFALLAGKKTTTGPDERRVSGAAPFPMPDITAVTPDAPAGIPGDGARWLRSRTVHDQTMLLGIACARGAIAERLRGLDDVTVRGHELPDVPMGH